MVVVFVQWGGGIGKNVEEEEDERDHYTGPLTFVQATKDGVNWICF